MKGLASDGGLFIPSEFPQLPPTFLEDWKDFSFTELAFNLLRLYIAQSEISNAVLEDMIVRSYSSFRSDVVTPLHKIDDRLYLLELFHGPTYAFKDVALQFVGNLFEFFLTRRNASKKEGEPRESITVVGATSGDTGSAAIYGLRGKKDVDVFILYPTGRISSIQEEQMTTVEEKNVHTISLKGTFDDCQDIVKLIFGDVEFNEKYHVGAINSINWARILAQITYYFYSYFALLKANPESKVRFVVPSGNFGDILAGYYAHRMGLPIDKLIIATNENDILDRFIKTGRYEKKSPGDLDIHVHATFSPAMDILVSSNFERLLWYLIRDNMHAESDAMAGQTLNKWMHQLKETGCVATPPVVHQAAKAVFDSERVTNQEIVQTIKRVYSATPEKYVVDPHTAVGVASTYRFLQTDSGEFQYISLSTAHPAKFSEVVNMALNEFEGYSFDRDVLPQDLKDLSTKLKLINLIENASAESVKQAIKDILKY